MAEAPRPDASRPDAPRSLAAQGALVERDLRMGQYFRAYDRARAALAVGPDDARLTLLLATALVRIGAVADARAAVARFDAVVDSLGDAAPDATDLLDDARACDLLTRVYKASWREGGEIDDLARARDLDLARFHRHGRLVEGASAALSCRTLHEMDRARALAHQAIDAAREVSDDADVRFADAMAAAEVALLLGRTEAADTELSRAASIAHATPELGVDARQRLADLRALGVCVPDPLAARFRPPTVVIFAGAAAQRPGTERPILPPGAQPLLAEAIDARLAELDAAIGYASLAAGSDILFAEAMLRRGAELNVVLPFDEADFIARRVAPAGRDWVARYHAVRERVADVSPVCHDLYLGDDVLLRFANQVIDGRARLRAARLDTDPFLIAAWDYLAEPRPGSPSDFIDHWGDPARLRIIDLADLREAAPPSPAVPRGADAAPPEPPLPESGLSQSVLAMLFADVVGYSAIMDQHLPAFWRYLAFVRDELGEALPAASHVASWGDALFIAAPRAHDIATIATRLNAVFEEVDARRHGLPARLRLRTGLHAGTAFVGAHPLSGERLLYGGAVNRAARIEPITVPGRIYASEQFVALLASEESAQAAEARVMGLTPPVSFTSRYRGELSLAKNYGRQAVYEIIAPEPLRRGPTPMRHEDSAVTATLSLTLANAMEEQRRLASALEDFAAEHGIEAALVTSFEMAFDEVLANIVSYAYDDEERHEIAVSLTWDGATLTAEVADDGRPFDPLAQAAPDVTTSLDEREVGGLGLFLVTELMDAVAYRRDGALNRLTFTKRAEG